MCIVLEDKRAAFFDVDSTLISWEPGGTLLLSSKDGSYNVSPIQEHIDLIKELKTVGWQIVVWSQGGSSHAHRVVKLLEIENLVDLIVSKPQVYVDDLPFEQQYIKRIYKVKNKEHLL